MKGERGQSCRSPDPARERMGSLLCRDGEEGRKRGSIRPASGRKRLALLRGMAI